MYYEHSGGNMVYGVYIDWTHTQICMYVYINTHAHLVLPNDIHLISHDIYRMHIYEALTAVLLGSGRDHRALPMQPAGLSRIS